jgi:hypothetical protein
MIKKVRCQHLVFFDPLLVLREAAHIVLRPVGGFSGLKKRVGCEREGLRQSVKKGKILIFHNPWRVDYYGAFITKEPEVFKFCYVHTKKRKKNAGM